MYGKLEEEHGLARHAMRIYDRATRAVSDEDRLEVRLSSKCAKDKPCSYTDTMLSLQMFNFYIAKASASFGVTATRDIYEKAIEVLPDRDARTMCLKYADIETKLGEIDRARAIFGHAAQFADPRVSLSKVYAGQQKKKKMLISFFF